MRFCTCGHDASAHSEEGLGYCIGTKLNGEPCDCERFLEQRETGSVQSSDGPVIPCHERETVEKILRCLVHKAYQSMGNLPVAIVVSLPDGDFGPQPPVCFELIFDGNRWFYQAVGEFEISGVPGQTWKIAVGHA